MPTISNCSVVGHLYRKPEIKKSDKGSSCRVSFWTSDKVKGEDTKKFTSWGGWVNGPQAEWLANADKGSLVYVSGGIRLDSHADKDGKIHNSIEFTRISECRLLDERDSNDGDTKPAASKRAVTNEAKINSAPATVTNKEDEPPF